MWLATNHVMWLSNNLHTYPTTLKEFHAVSKSSESLDLQISNQTLNPKACLLQRSSNLKTLPNMDFVWDWSCDISWSTFLSINQDLHDTPPPAKKKVQSIRLTEAPCCRKLSPQTSKGKIKTKGHNKNNVLIMCSVWCDTDYFQSGDIYLTDWMRKGGLLHFSFWLCAVKLYLPVEHKPWKLFVVISTIWANNILAPIFVCL